MTNTQQRTEYRRGHKKTSRWSFAPSLGKKKVRIESPEETADIDARIDAVVASDRITVRRQPPPQAQQMAGPVGLVRDPHRRCLDVHPPR